MLLDKRNALYVKCCIIANGVTDSQGDTLYAEDIKRIFTSFNNQDNFEIYHDELPIEEVSLLENYISSADESIGNLTVPAESWNAIVRVDNPEIQEGLLTGKFKGVSLNNRLKPKCRANLHGTIRYKDVSDAECIIPLFISFVEAGANGYPLHVMDYEAYIQKSRAVEPTKNGAKIMDFKEFLNGLKSLIKEAEDTPEEEPAIEKEEDEETKEEATEVETTEEVEETKEEEPAIEKAEEEETSEEEEPVIEKEDEPATEEDPAEEEAKEDLEARVAKLEELVAELTQKPEVEEENPDPEEEPEDEDTPKITKSEKVVLTENKTIQHSNYYEMSGRDPLTGKKLRK